MSKLFTNMFERFSLDLYESTVIFFDYFVLVCLKKRSFTIRDVIWLPKIAGYK